MPTIKDNSRKQPDWNIDAERLILYADFMGFKNRIYSNSHETIKKELEAFNSKFTNKIKPLQNGDYLKFVQFSDSILIVVNGVNDRMFNLITKASVCLFHVSMEMRIPIKGVIAKGLFTYDKEKEIYFGKPLIDAYLLHEEIKFYGIVVHHSAESIIKKYSNNTNPYLNSQIYLEKGKVCHHHLCWNLLKQNLSSGDITDDCKKWLENIGETVSGSPRMYIDRTIEVLESDKEQYKCDNEVNDAI